MKKDRLTGNQVLHLYKFFCPFFFSLIFSTTIDGNKLLYAMEHADRIFAGFVLSNNWKDLLAGIVVAVFAATFVDPGDLSNFEKAIQENTKAVFIETLGNPNSNIIDIKALNGLIVAPVSRNKIARIRTA